VDNNNKDFGEIGCGAMNQTDLAQDKSQWWAHVKTVLNLLVTQNAGKFLNGCMTSGLL
jgi:hypothetical protein